jgi:transketolase
MKNSGKTTEKISIEELSINTIRTLSMDAVQNANSGHPGTPMALAPLAYVLWKKFLKFNPKNPQWFDRDRFVLSNGHASMLLYSILYLTGYDISLDDIKNFRQWDSKTPGHPEYKHTPGVETTTGPLGQGIMNSVGMAIAEAHLAAHFNRENHDIVNHYTYAFCSDGDFMEGASNEAASIAGHQKLGRLIWFYDNNHISIEGNTNITYSDNVAQRFKGYNWHVQDIGEKANDIDALSEAIENARTETGKPSLIILRSHIGYGAPDKQDTPEAHGSPLGEDEVKAAKEFYDWPSDEAFYVPDEVLDHMRDSIEKGDAEENTWKVKIEDYQKKFPELAKEFEDHLKRELPEDWDSDIPHFTPDDGPIATRKASSKIISSFASKIPWLVGGSGDLAPSTNTLIDDSDYIEADNYDNRNIAWGVREHAMCAASSGIYLHGGLKPFAATFFIFTDYARPAIRLAALMELPVIYIMTHDSIGLGEDGPTHQPVEHLASFRAMPNMTVIRPADANETAYAWRAALMRKSGPTMIVLTRQKIPVFDGRKVANAAGLLRGAYIISKEKGERPDVILIGSGSEVSLLLDSKEKLVEENINVRIVSMPSWELFKEQEMEYRNEILPPEITKRLAVEAGASFGWCEWVGNEGAIIGVDKFGASAPSKEIFKHYGFTIDNVVNKTKELLNK